MNRRELDAHHKRHWRRGFPDKKAREVLEAKWQVTPPLQLIEGVRQRVH
jgi:hypothetical protein